jgi:uncharacterized membrane protein YtjA (UPF0391 family)
MLLHWKAIYLILALVFGVIGFIGIGEGGIEPAKYICGLFVLLLLVFLIVGRKKEKE